MSFKDKLIMGLLVLYGVQLFIAGILNLTKRKLTPDLFAFLLRKFSGKPDEPLLGQNPSYKATGMFYICLGVGSIVFVLILMSEF